MGGHGTLVVDLDEASDAGGKDRDGHANSHAVEEEDAAVEVGDMANNGDDEAIVEADGREHSEDGYGAQGGCIRRRG